MLKNFRFIFIAALICMSGNSCFSQIKGWFESDSTEFTGLIPLLPAAKSTGKPLPPKGPWNGLQNLHEDTLTIGLWLSSDYSSSELRITQVYPFIKGVYREFEAFAETADTEEAIVVGKNEKGHILLVLDYRGTDTTFQDVFENFEGHCYSYVNQGIQKTDFLGKKGSLAFFKFYKKE